MILVSGTKETGFDVTVKLSKKSPLFEVAIDYEGEIEDISASLFSLNIDGKKFPGIVEDGIVKFDPAQIYLNVGIYSFDVQMDKNQILSGYIEWAGDDN